MSKRYFGKYRGTVVNDIDPLRTGRLLVQVPDVTGPGPSTWAMPCFPATGAQHGTWMLPTRGAGVWVEYEQGDSHYPIWAGCWYGSVAEVPAMALAAPPGVPHVVLQTVRQNALVISDAPGPAGGILIKSATGALISVNELGITLSNGKGADITMTGRTVTVNQGALVVT
ncbi:baseplate assembly protein [Streptomyces triculaminicus]|uniref:Baseplate assembly protein n=2 Tax=Streptomyces TaxID=1883 RepID=A0A939FLQ1_9ACTN|nr:MULTISPECIES: phage baseplate assembly protein V [Streptomyces]MBO0654496.1 baseplate assembly protein [Streptomyces triculaminicus]QSY49111.1 baseplate assembly protein [Streptomyces griseocarneus]